MTEVGSGGIGFIAVSAMWAIYVIGDRVFRDRADRNRQSKHDEATETLLKALNSSVTQGNEMVAKERERNHTLNLQLIEQAHSLGHARGEVEFERRKRMVLEETLQKTVDSAESLAIEVVNLRKSNEELVRFNRELLKQYIPT